MGKSQNSAAEFTLSEQEIQRLIDSTTTFRNRVLIRTLYLTGIRREELCNLDVADVQLDRKRLTIRHGKGDKSRIVPLTDSLVNDLRALIGRRSTGPVFVSQRGGRLNARTVNYIVEDAGKGAGLTNPNPERKTINPHLLRHSFARHYLHNGGRMHLLSQILGHADVSITHSVYGTASAEEVQEEYGKVMGDEQDTSGAIPAC